MCYEVIILFQLCCFCFWKILRKIQEICKKRPAPRKVCHYSYSNYVSYVPLRENVTHGFINWGEPTSKMGPGDKTGASYAFDLWDWANGTYHYDI